MWILRIKAEAGFAWSFLFGSSNSFCRSSDLLISAVLVNSLSPQRSANFFDVCNLCVKICNIYEQMHKNDGIAVFDLNVDSRFQQQRGLLFVEQLKSVETVQISLLLFHPPTKNTQTPANNPLSKLSRTCRRLLALILFTDLPWNLSLSPSQKRYFIKLFFCNPTSPFQ